MALSNREAFLARIDTICKRPGMYVGTDSLRDVSIYLYGMEDGLTCSSVGEGWMKTWPRWLEGRYLVRHQAMPWTQVLCDVLGSDKAALTALPGLYREFFKDLDSLGEEGIEQRTFQQFIARPPSGN